MLFKSFALRKVAVTVGLASCLFSMGVAHADSVHLKETGLGLGMASGGLVLPVQTSSANYWAGFQTIVVNDTTSFQALCVDPYQWSPSSDTTYNRSYAVGDFNTFFGSKAGDVVALFNEGFAAATDNTKAAAMQLALWEVGNDNKNLSNGIVHTVSGTNAGLISATQNLLANLGSYSGPSHYAFTLYTSSTNQDYLVASPVPEPESYAMLLAGLGLLGFMARRRKMKLEA